MVGTQGAAETLGRQERDGDGLVGSNSQLQNIQVLIVDDEKMIQRLVYDVLAQLGFRQITVASSGRQAIHLVATKPFDFVITDWRMQDLDGIDLVDFVRKSPESKCPHVPVILLTGNSEAHYVVRARDAGVNEYIIKPFAAEQLVKRIRAVIEKPRPFVVTKNYRGPDRRHQDLPPPDGKERRKQRHRPEPSES